MKRGVPIIERATPVQRNHTGNPKFDQESHCGAMKKRPIPINQPAINRPATISGSPDIKVGLSPCRSDQESCDLGRKRLIHGFFWDLSLSSVSLPLSTAAYAGPALAGGPARRLPRVDVKCSIYGCYSMTDGLETPRKLCRFAELRPTLMSGDSNKYASFLLFLNAFLQGPRLCDESKVESQFQLRRKSRL